VRHSIEWQDDAVNAAPEERATVGDLRLFLNDQNVTMHMINEKVGDHVTVALYGLANGLVHDWWSILGARDREFSLRRYRTGYLLPDIRITFDGSIFEVSALQCVYTDPDLRFFGGTSEVLSRHEGEAWLTALIQEVLARLKDRGVPGTSAELRWQRIRSSINRGEGLFCEAAGGLGLDPYQIADDVADFIERAENVFEAESVVEFVSGAGEVDRAKLISWVDQMVRFTGSRYRLPELRSIADGMAKNDSKGSAKAAWAAGYRRARKMRDVLGLKQSDRVSSFRALAQLLGARAYDLAPKVDGINALRRETSNGIDVHVRNHGNPQGHLFALARGVGDSVCFPEPETAPINRLRHAYRQAAGRAFAAEFLAPIEEIRSMLEDERDEYSIASEFGVSPALIEHQIENQDRIAEALA